jgi:hypothetical protein
MPRVENSPFYRYDPNLGSPRDRYLRADVAHPEARQPEIAARFVAYVEGETLINTMHGQRRVVWGAEPGTQCIILGYWSDGTVHLKWPAIGGVYQVDGRFPAWVAVEDKETPLAGGGRILSANDPDVRRPGLPLQVLAMASVVLLVLILLLALPPTRDALSALAAELLRSLRPG